MVPILLIFIYRHDPEVPSCFVGISLSLSVKPLIMSAVLFSLARTKKKGQGQQQGLGPVSLIGRWRLDLETKGMVR